MSLRSSRCPVAVGQRLFDRLRQVALEEQRLGGAAVAGGGAGGAVDAAADQHRHEVLQSGIEVLPVDGGDELLDGCGVPHRRDGAARSGSSEWPAAARSRGRRVPAHSARTGTRRKTRVLLDDEAPR
jgi:hypothetical protein